MLKSHLEAGRIEVGCDEAGRGCLAGAVFAAAVLLPDGFSAPMLNDSKQLTEKQRDTLRLQIEKDTIWAVGIVSEREIDEINILNASFLAMHRALAQINAKFEHILVDGNRFKAYQNIPHSCIVKGDGKYLSIAAASVLAKTHRDEAMLRLAAEYPMYDWHKNKGYPTQAHRKAIAEYGATDYHRHSFQLLPLENQQTELFDTTKKK